MTGELEHPLTSPEQTKDDFPPPNPLPEPEEICRMLRKVSVECLFPTEDGGYLVLIKNKQKVDGSVCTVESYLKIGPISTPWKVETVILPWQGWYGKKIYRGQET